MVWIVSWPTYLAGYFIYYLIVWFGIATAEPNCDAVDTVLTRQADFDKLVKGCTELGGNLEIALVHDSLEITGITRIRGNLFVRDGLPGLQNYTKINPDARDISFASLKLVDGNFEVSKLGQDLKANTIMPTLSMGWIDVGGTAYIHNTDMNLLTVDIGTTDKLTFSENFSVNDHDFFRLPLVTNELELSRNSFTKAVGAESVYQFPDITSMNRKIYIEASSQRASEFESNIVPEYSGLRMPKLQFIPQIYIEQATTIDLPSIQNISISLELDTIKTTKLELPELINIGTGRDGSFILRSAAKLFKIDLPLLETIQGNLELSNNPLLKDIAGFAKLRTITGDVSLDGPIWSLTLPSLASINGSFTLSSSAPFNCTPWNERQIRTRFVQGNYTCESTVDPLYLEAGFDRNSAGLDGLGSDSAPGAPNRIPMIAGSSAGAVVAIVGIGIGIFYFRRRPRKLPDLLPGIANPELGATEAPLYEVDARKTEIKAEAVGYIPRTELDGDFQPAEMFVSDTVPVELAGSEPESTRPPSAAFTRNSVHNRERGGSGFSNLPAEGGRNS